MPGLASWIDRAFATLGIDPHRFAQAHPERAERLAFWLLGVAQTVGYGAFFYIFAALLLAWEEALPYGKGWLAFAFMCATLIRASDADYFNLSRRDKAEARTAPTRHAPSVKQGKRAFELMRGATPREMRDKALFALLCLTGIRVGARVSLRLKHIVLEEKPVT